MASHVLPSSTLASSATNPAAGGAALADPMPTGWNAPSTWPHRDDAPSQAGTSAPPPSGPPPISECSAIAATTIRPAVSSTPGRVMKRCRKPESVSSESSSVGSSMADRPDAGSGLAERVTSSAKNSAARRSEWPRWRSARTRL